MGLLHLLPILTVFVRYSYCRVVNIPNDGSCIINDERYQNNQRFPATHFWYLCEDGRLTGPHGCVASGTLYENNEKFMYRTVRYECHVNEGGASMDIIGCTNDGKNFTIGDTNDVDCYRHQCTNLGWKVMGCLFDTQEGKVFHVLGTAYETGRILTGDIAMVTTGDCRVRENGYISQEPAISCQLFQNNVEILSMNFDDCAKYFNHNGEELVFYCQGNNYGLTPRNNFRGELCA